MILMLLIFYKKIKLSCRVTRMYVQCLATLIHTVDTESYEKSLFGVPEVLHSLWENWLDNDYCLMIVGKLQKNIQ